MSIARYIGWGLPNREEMPLRCGCRGMIALEQVGHIVIATCLGCGATWDMVVLSVTTTRQS